MSIEYPFSLAQLAQILSALENERRNPNTKRNAIKAIERTAAQIGLAAEDIFDAADGLLSGRLGAATWRVHLRDGGCGSATVVTEGSVEAAPANEPADAHPQPNAAPPAVTPRRLSGSRPHRSPQGVRSTKQARMIAMLQRAEAATIEQIAEAMGWARHTVRGALAGALKKRLGLTVTSRKSADGPRVYRIGA